MGAMGKVIFGKLLGAGLGLGAEYLTNAIRGEKAKSERAAEDAEAKRKLDIIKLYKAGGGEMTETGKAAEIEIFQNLIDSAPQHLRDQTDQFIDDRNTPFLEAQPAGVSMTGGQDPNLDPGGELQGTVQNQGPSKQSFFEATKDVLVPIGDQEVPLNQLSPANQKAFIQSMDPQQRDLLKKKILSEEATANQRNASAFSSGETGKRTAQTTAQEAEEFKRESELKPVNDLLSNAKQQIDIAMTNRKNAKTKADIEEADADINLWSQNLTLLATWKIKESEYDKKVGDLKMWEAVFSQYKILYQDPQAAWDAFVTTPMGKWAKEQQQKATPTPAVSKKRVEPFPKSRGALHRAR